MHSIGAEDKEGDDSGIIIFKVLTCEAVRKLWSQKRSIIPIEERNG